LAEARVSESAAERTWRQRVQAQVNPL
jgi:hypothetical protein